MLCGRLEGGIRRCRFNICLIMRPLCLSFRSSSLIEVTTSIYVYFFLISVGCISTSTFGVILIVPPTLSTPVDYITSPASLDYKLNRQHDLANRYISSGASRTEQRDKRTRSIKNWQSGEVGRRGSKNTWAKIADVNASVEIARSNHVGLAGNCFRSHSLSYLCSQNGHFRSRAE
jgi:hypothetical protein